MRIAILLSLTMLASTVCAQTSGRHFRRTDRTPDTPPAATRAAADASASTRPVAPLPKLRSGRAWPSHHFGRLPRPAVGTGEAKPVDAAHPAPAPRRRGFWRPLR